MNKTNQAIQTHIRLEVQQLEFPYFYHSSVTTADLICKSQNTQRHPYNSAAYRLCKCTDPASCIFALLIATGNQHSCFLTAVHTLHREQAPVAECGSISEQATGSLNTSKHIPSQKNTIMCSRTVFFNIVKQHLWAADKNFCSNKSPFPPGRKICGLKTTPHFIRSTR